MELEYTKREDAEKALRLNLKEYKLNNVKFMIHVRIRESGPRGDHRISYINEIID